MYEKPCVSLTFFFTQISSMCHTCQSKSSVYKIEFTAQPVLGNPDVVKANALVENLQVQASRIRKKLQGINEVKNKCIKCKKNGGR